MCEQTCEGGDTYLFEYRYTTIFIKLRHQRNESNTATREDIYQLEYRYNQERE